MYYDWLHGFDTKAKSLFMVGVVALLLSRNDSL
jgi:hypothetical protein